MKKILFLHGFFATGSCPMARALREAFDGQAIVLTPDLPLHPKEALKYIRMLIDKEKPDLLIGNSCGAFLAQMLSPVVGIPALLGNPHFKMTDFLRERIGEHKYKAPRMDGNQKIVIDESLIHEFEQLEATQFDCCNPYYKDQVWGYLVSKTLWLILNRCSCSTITTAITSLADTRPQSRKSRLGMPRWHRRCPWSIQLKKKDFSVTSREECTSISIPHMTAKLRNAWWYIKHYMVRKHTGFVPRRCFSSK